MSNKQPSIDSDDEKERKAAFLIMAIETGLLSDEQVRKIRDAALKRKRYLDGLN
jgi:hypothetical protein